MRDLNQMYLSISNSLKQFIFKYGIECMPSNIRNLIREAKFDLVKVIPKLLCIGEYTVIVTNELPDTLLLCKFQR